jgi:hypothetical protein
VTTIAVAYGELYGQTTSQDGWRKFEVPGISSLAIVDAKKSSGLSDDEEVIGVVVAGHARAYRLKALRYPPWHIVNDLVEGVPVSVAYCNQTECARVYTRPGASSTLDLSHAGLLNGEMDVKVGKSYYFHGTGLPLEPGTDNASFPYDKLPSTRNSWGAWRHQFPETDVFLGERKADGT